MTSEDLRADLITRLLESLIDNPRGLSLVASPLTRRVNWHAQVDISDMGRMIGKGSAHRLSLKLLVGLMGRKLGEDWRFEIDEPQDGDRRDRQDHPAPKNFDPGPAGTLLMEILMAILSGEPAVRIRYDKSEFTFVITDLTIQDYELLVTSITMDKATMQPIVALGTLWRAYGKQQGVSFKVEVPSR